MIASKMWRASSRTTLPKAAILSRQRFLSPYVLSFNSRLSSSKVHLSGHSTSILSRTLSTDTIPEYEYVHPLKPLSGDEISKVAETVRSHLGIQAEEDPKSEKLRFVAISLKEPKKSDYVADTISERLGEVVTLDPTSGLASEYVVDVSNGLIVTQKELAPGVQPMFTPEDCDLAESIVQNDPEIAKVMEDRYGITDMKRVACDPWSVHFASAEDRALADKGDRPGRLVQTFLYFRQNGDAMQSNHYAHPIDMLPVVDLNTRSVVTIGGLDRLPAPQIPTNSVNYHRELLHTNSYLEASWREDTAKALDVVQPEGPSFQVSNGNLVSWQKWTFRVGFNYREGLVLHDVAFDGRPVMHRASLVEMAVPYGDPHPPFQRKCAFDVGDYGLGYCANSLELGCDCLGHIHYFDATMSDVAGSPQVKKKAVCMHEEDQGILWKHVDYRNGHNESRRSRELVVSSIATVVNYEYLFYWRLKQDGTIDYEIKLTGELSTNLLSAGEGDKPTHGVLVAPGVNSQVHQHMFCARLDMAVDGQNNVVSEVNVEAPSISEENPYGNSFRAVEEVLATEKSAIRTADASKARAWKIASATKKNKINGKPTAYKLVPFTRGAAQPTLLLDPSSDVAKKGAFAQSNLWVTRFAEDERYPAGEYTPQGNGTMGLPSWTSADRDIVDKDIVLWHAFGVCHVPRVEDFPVMPCEMTGFSLKPDNFFEGNPSIDLPPESNAASKLAKSCCD